MASILFDDITFPRELYDPDTFEFVAPVSTLLSFTPHILSQLAKDSQEQDPLPLKDDDPKEEEEAEASKKKTRHTQKDSGGGGGLFSTFKNFAVSQGTQGLVENGLYFAGRYMEGSAASASARQTQEERAFARERQDREGRFGYNSSNANASSSSYWFGFKDQKDQERERLKDMEAKLQRMEKEFDRNSVLARSEVESQRRERYRLERELEAQKEKVKKMEAELEQQKKKEAQKEKEGEERKKKEGEDAKKKEKEKEKHKKEELELKAKKSSLEEDKNSSLDEKQALLKTTDSDMAIQAVMMASVGVASLVLSLYSAHKASTNLSVVNFHDQLEQLLEQCQSVVVSTEAWMSEQFLEVPEQIREDLRMIKELMETIQRLDPRSEKKAEALAWSMSAVGSLGAVGGAVLGSMTAMASGGTLIVGCALYGIVSRARYNGPEYNAARTMMEVRAAQILKSLGVSPAAASASSSSSSGKGNAVTQRQRPNGATLIHASRVERLRLEFERREGNDLLDADEIDGLVVEEALDQAAYSGVYVPGTAKRSRQATAEAAVAAAQRSVAQEEDEKVVRSASKQRASVVMA